MRQCNIQRFARISLPTVFFTRSFVSKKKLLLQPLIIGWGATTYPGLPTTILRETTLPVVEGKKCGHNNNVVCVGKGFGKGPDGKQWPNACKGDSGEWLISEIF